jgi:hypothetical protein
MVAAERVLSLAARERDLTHVDHTSSRAQKSVGALILSIA